MYVADHNRAKAVPIEELPKLTDEQKVIAKEFAMSEEAWARSLLAAQYGESRLHARANALAPIREGYLPKFVAKAQIEKSICHVCLEDHKIWLRHRNKNGVVRLKSSRIRAKTRRLDGPADT